MRITTKIVFDMSTWEVLEHEHYEYDGELCLGKGDGTAKDLLNFNKDLVTKQVARQTKTQDQISGAVSGDLSGKNGFPPELMAALVAQFQNQNTALFQGAGSNVRSALASRGSGDGMLPVGGDYARGIAELEGAKATSQAQGNLGVGIDSLHQALLNKWNAVNALNGVAAQAGNNIGTFNNGANNALNTYVQAANQGFGNAFTSQFGGAFGKGLGGLATFGLGQAAGGIPGFGNPNKAPG